jgi:hypothetical protein
LISAAELAEYEQITRAESVDGTMGAARPGDMGTEAFIKWQGTICAMA